MLPLFAVAIFLYGIPAVVVYAFDGQAIVTLLHRFRDYCINQRSFHDIMNSSSATNAIANCVLACCVSHAISPLFHIKKPNYRANTRESIMLSVQSTPAVGQAAPSALAHRTAGGFHDLATTAAPIIHCNLFALVFFMKSCHDPENMMHSQGPVGVDYALPSHFRPSYWQSEVHSSSHFLMIGASVMLLSGPAYATAMTWSNFLILRITSKHASTVVSILELCRPRRTSYIIFGLKSWTAGSSIYHEISRPSPVSLVRLYVWPLAANVGFDICRVLSAFVFISNWMSTLQTYYLHIAVNRYHPSFSMKVILCPTTVSPVPALLVETSAADSRSKQVAQRFIQILFTFSAESSVMCSRCAADVFYCPAFEEFKHRVLLAIVEFIIFVLCLAMSTLVGFSAAICLHRRPSLTTLPRHLVALQYTLVLFFCKYLFEFRCASKLQNLVKASRFKRYIQNATCAIYCSTVHSSVTTSCRESSGACSLGYIIKCIAAHLLIKVCAFFRFSASLNTTIMTLVLYSIRCPITNAHTCEQFMLGMKRSSLVSATLPMSLMFFAGGYTGAS